MNKAKTEQNEMGKVIVTLTLTNWADEVLADRGFISSAEV